MNPSMRRYRDEEDYWRIRDFLRKVFLLNGRREISWQVSRFDYWRWHGIENILRCRIEEVVFIWETTDKEIVGVLHSERKGDAFLQVHPGLRTPELEEEMLIAAEKHLAIQGSNGQRKLCVWAHEHDDLRQSILKRRSYKKGGTPEHHQRRSLDAPILEGRPPSGYIIRALGDQKEVPERSFVSWITFHPDEPVEGYEGWGWYSNIQSAPLYRRDLDIVAVTSSGEFAAFCTVWFDDVTRTGMFEPVGTAPKHQRRGLGKAIMCESLRRLKRMGATMAYVGSYSPAAHALYTSAGFIEYELSEPWIKEL